MKVAQTHGDSMGYLIIYRDMIYVYIWLVVLTMLKNISQREGLSHILWKIKAMFETTNHNSIGGWD